MLERQERKQALRRYNLAAAPPDANDDPGRQELPLRHAALSEIAPIEARGDALELSRDHHRLSVQQPTLGSAAFADPPINTLEFRGPDRRVMFVERLNQRIEQHAEVPLQERNKLDVGHLPLLPEAEPVRDA